MRYVPTDPHAVRRRCRKSPEGCGHQPSTKAGRWPCTQRRHRANTVWVGNLAGQATLRSVRRAALLLYDSPSDNRFPQHTKRGICGCSERQLQLRSLSPLTSSSRPCLRQSQDQAKRLFAVERGGSLMQGLVALRWDGCCDTSAQTTRTTSCDRAYVLAA